MAKRAVITGVGDTPCGVLRGSSALSLRADAAMAAFVDAGLALEDIDGLQCAYALTAPHIMPTSVLENTWG